jgi:hypothetical protein
MHAAVRSSVAAGAVMATAGALVAAPIAPAPEIKAIPVQSHDIELAALPAGAIIGALLENQVQNASEIFQSAVAFGTNSVQTGAATVTAPITFVQTLTAPDGTPLKAIGATAESILNPLYLAGSAIINPAYAIGGRVLFDLVLAGIGAANIGEEGLGLVLETGLGILAAPAAATRALADTGDINQAINAGIGAFNHYFSDGFDQFTGTIEASRENLYEALKVPLFSPPTLSFAAQQAAAARAAVQPQAALPSTQDAKNAFVKRHTGVNPNFASARKVADSLKQTLAADSSQDGVTQVKRAGRHAGTDKASSSAGADQGSGHSGTGGKHAKHAK